MLVLHCMKYISTFGYHIWSWLYCPDMNHSFTPHATRVIQFSRKWTEEDEAYDWMSTIGFLIHPNSEMMKTLSDKAVTNQSHCESRRTVKDISGQSSHELVRKGRPVTANSHSAPLTLWSHKNALCSCYFLFHPIAVLQLPHSLSSVLSSSRHAPSCLWRPDRRTQAALIGVDRWLCATEASGVTAEPVWPVVVTKANARPKHTRIHPKPHRSCQHAKMSINTGTS